MVLIIVLLSTGIHQYSPVVEVEVASPESNRTRLHDTQSLCYSITAHDQHHVIPIVETTQRCFSGVLQSRRLVLKYIFR